MDNRSRNLLGPHDGKHRPDLRDSSRPLSSASRLPAPYVWAQNRAGLLLSFRSRFHPFRETNMNELVENILGDPTLELTATDRIILLHLGQHPSGSRIEDIARCTGSKYRWVENQVSKLTRVGLLQRVGPNTYAINSTRQVQK